jgi:hypothetical protein
LQSISCRIEAVCLKTLQDAKDQSGIAQAARQNSPFFELAHLLVRLDHVARFIVNANHGIM